MKKVVVALAILLLAGAVLWLAAQPESAGQRMPTMVRFDQKSVDAISISGVAPEAVILKRTGEKWLLQGGKEAEGTAVEHLLNDLATMQIVRVVSRSPANDESLGFGKGSVQVVLTGGDRELLGVTIGKQGSDLISTYLKLAGRPEVLAVDKTLLWQVKRPAEGWAAVKQGGREEAKP